MTHFVCVVLIMLFHMAGLSVQILVGVFSMEFIYSYVIIEPLHVYNTFKTHILCCLTTVSK